MTTKTEPLWTLSDLTTALECSVDASQFAHQDITGVSIDTRTLEKGDLFVALKGDLGDGHSYIGSAIEKGASAALSAEAHDGPIVKVDDTLKALNSLAHAGRERSSALRIGVTGSAGKTGTKELLSIVFSEFGKTHHSVKSYNNHWGVPLTLARMPQDTEYGVFEAGMNHAGELSELTQLIRPDIAIITSIASVHFENFDNEQGIARAKSEIFEGVPEDGYAIINADTPHFDLLKKRAEECGIKNIISFGEDQDCDAYPIDMTLSSDGTKVTAMIMDEKVNFRLSIPGKHIASNALSVLCAVKCEGCDVKKAAKTLSKAEPIEGRGRKIEVVIEDGEPPITIIDESYNASPAAMRAAFKVLHMNAPKGNGQRIAVLGDMLELGPKGPQLHAALANPLLKAEVGMVFACGPQMGALYDVLPPPWQGAHTKDSLTLCAEVTKAVKPGDVILVKGSNGSKMAYVVEALQNMQSSKGENRHAV